MLYIKLEEDIKELKKKKEGLEGIDLQKAAKETELKGLEKTLASYNEELERLKSEILNYLPDATIEAKRKKLEMLQNERRETEGKLSKFGEKKGELEGRKREIEEFLRILGESDICPVCKGKLTPEHREKVREDFKKEIENRSSESEKLEKHLKELNDKKKVIEVQLDEVKKLDVERLQSLQDEIKKCNTIIEKLNKELEELKPTVEELKSAKNKLEEQEKRQTELKNDYERYILAKRVLENEKSEEEVSLELEKLKKEMNDLKMNYDQLIEKIGYLPSDPEKELGDLKKLRRNTTS